MKNYLPNEDLNMLKNIKDEICITIISPTHHLATDRKANQLQLENCIRNTEKKLKANYDVATVDKLIKVYLDFLQPIIQIQKVNLPFITYTRFYPT